METARQLTLAFLFLLKIGSGSIQFAPQLINEKLADERIRMPILRFQMTK